MGSSSAGASASPSAGASGSASGGAYSAGVAGASGGGAFLNRVSIGTGDTNSKLMVESPNNDVEVARFGSQAGNSGSVTGKTSCQGAGSTSDSGYYWRPPPGSPNYCTYAFTTFGLGEILKLSAQYRVHESLGATR